MTGRASIRVSKHAFSRAGDRCPFQRQSLQKESERAFDQGLRPHDIKNKDLRNYLVALGRQVGDECRIRGGNVFIYRFADGDFILVTIFPLMKEFIKAASKEVRDE
jgi:hypothetical protein